MRSVLRRLLWLAPALVLITMVTFGALSVALDGEGGAERLPLFFNPEPGSVERLSTRALRAIAASGVRMPEAEAELVQLGGAALPFVLPALDSLSPEGRARVVGALRPVGVRMGFELDPSWQASREVLFWTRFWEEHSIDYRPQVARRAVGRLVQKNTALRDAEVRQLDTYALDELLRHFGSVDDVGDVERIRQLSELAFDMLGRPSPRGNWRLPATAGVEEARSVAATWTEWWSRNRTRYRMYSGTDRIAAMLRDTRYGGWVAQAVRHDLGLRDDGRSVGEVLRQGALVSAPLLLAGMFGALCTAALGGVLAALVERRSLRWLSALFVARAALPVAVVAALASSLWPAARNVWLGALVMALAGAPLASLHRGARLEARGSHFIRTLESLGVARWRVALTTLRLSSAGLIVQLGAQLSALITLTFVVEYVFGLSGLGRETIDALKHPDLNWLMAITIVTALFVGLLQGASELLLATLDPRWKDSIDRLGGAA